MASKNKSWPQISGDTLEEKFDMIMESLSKLNERLCSTTEDPLGRSDKEKGITERHSQKGTLEKSHSAPPALGLVPFDDQLIMRLNHNLQMLKLRLGKLEQLQINVGEELGTHLVTVHSLLDFFRVSSQNTIKLDLEGMDSKISDLLYQVPLLSVKTEKQNAAAYGVQDDEDEVHQEKSYYDLPGIHTNMADLTKLEVFRQVKHKFKELDIEQKICLLSFAVFPENREVHRTMLMYWWIGEGIIPVQGAEEAVRKVLKEFTDKKLVEPVEERRKLAPSSYKMSPFVHSSVVLLSKEIGIFDIYRQGQKPTMTCSKMGKVCLVEGSSSQPEKTPTKMLSRDHIETVINISEGFPEFTLNWFSEQPSNKKFMIKLSKTWFKALKVFYLGRWERSKKRDIRIQDPRLMQCLKHLKKLRFLSFQGISTISSLNSSVCKLHKLIILDLRDCSDLKRLPEKINSLRNLVYLDMTGCYMLEWIPFSLALLTRLEVLKGFVISDEVYEVVACKLKYLTVLKKLRKLSIEINRDDLGVGQMMADLAGLKALKSLKVTWRRDLRITYRDSTQNVSLPGQLKKLDLQRFPHEELPTWLHPLNLLHLKKLHIGGGRLLKGFGNLCEKATQCAVEVLRLTSLPELKVDWMELKHIYFPNLTFLENYKCPKITLSPCDGNGIWRSDQ
ncbi:Disease resistance RPP13-like protein 4 [Cardamine amara subsp. amara]|uniref:Disease resistance RPP13-like protein 4 n=1 Tax=Cardamine amara subsp. amara TaxID=228776 RepID=A0ABD1C5J0_CARAN